MKLNEAVSRRLLELLEQRNMTQYQLYQNSGVPKSTIANIVHCSYDSVKLRILHELCQGLEIDLPSFFQSPLFEENDLEP
ncbi:MAG: helix-turn-helix transcriptional regulator [Candidatus Limiplasma sp.]|nr:helix-turn-helix transcriptional regulator [Candidatus Limiplasma sp.]